MKTKISSDVLYKVTVTFLVLACGGALAFSVCWQNNQAEKRAKEDVAKYIALHTLWEDEIIPFDVDSLPSECFLQLDDVMQARFSKDIANGRIVKAIPVGRDQKVKAFSKGASVFFVYEERGITAAGLNELIMSQDAAGRYCFVNDYEGVIYVYYFPEGFKFENV